MKTRETHTVTLHYDEDKKVLHVVFKKEFEMTVDHVIEIEKIMSSLIKSPVFIIVDGRHSDGTVSYEAQQYIAKSEIINALRIMTVFVIKNLAQRLVANFYIRHLRKRDNFKIVRKIEDAYEEIEQRKMAS